MAVDVQTMASNRSNRVAGDIDARVMRRLTMIAGGALLFLVAVKLGFMGNVMP